MHKSNLTFGQQRNNRISLKGVAKNFNNQIEIEDMSEMKDLNLPGSNRTVLPDSLNHFEILFSLKKPGYFRIGRNILYLSMGNNMDIFIDKTWPDSSTFKGYGSQANEYLKLTPFPKAGSFLEAGDNIKNTIPQTVKEIFNLANKRKRALNKCVHVSANFKILEQARIKADVINSLLMIKTYFPSINKLDSASLVKFKRDYFDIVDPYLKSYSHDFLDPLFLQLPVYRQIIETILPYTSGSSKNVRTIRDWIKAQQLVENIRGIEEKKQIAYFKNKIKKIQTPEYRLAINTTFNELLKFGNGDTATDFIITNNNNESFHLNSLIGKVIYIDLWATWCGPCIEEFPQLEILKEKYKNQANMVFLTLSIDENKLLWKKKLIDKNGTGVQGIIDRAKLKEYRIINIPRVIIINKDFKVVSMNGPLPSNNNTASLLDSLLN